MHALNIIAHNAACRDDVSGNERATRLCALAVIAQKKGPDMSGPYKLSS